MSRFRNALVGLGCVIGAYWGWMMEWMGFDEQDDVVKLAKQEYRKRQAALSNAQRVKRRG